MESVSLFEAKTHLSALVERAGKGETIVITKHGRPTAKIVPIEEPKARMSHDEIVEGFRRLRKRSKGFTIEEIIAMKHEGHRF